MNFSVEETKFLSRKWMLSVGIQVFSVIALANGWLVGEVFGEITVANIISYSFANAAAYFGKGGYGHVNEFSSKV